MVGFSGTWQDMVKEKRRLRDAGEKDKGFSHRPATSISEQKIADGFKKKYVSQRPAAWFTRENKAYRRYG